jgi:hypothetical protein
MVTAFDHDVDAETNWRFYDDHKGSLWRCLMFHDLRKTILCKRSDAAIKATGDDGRNETGARRP